MLTEREKNGVRKLLKKMPDEELVQLANTVTNRLIAVQNRNEAIGAITMYSDSAEQLLRRKLVKRDLIFVYLADNDVALSPAADKYQIIMKVLEYWQSTSAPKYMNRIKDEPVTGQNPGTSREFSDSSKHEVSLSQENSRYSSHRPDATPSWIPQLAEQFSSWFFTQLVNLHPSRSQTSDWGPQHFLSDVTLKLCVIRGSDRTLDAYDGAELVSQRLKCLVTEECLIFSPNLSSEGTKGCSDPHGLVMVAVCGTIHSAGTCVGLFEQKFGLVRDPLAADNWKIKFINMQIKTGSSFSVPTLDAFSQAKAITA